MCRFDPRHHLRMKAEPTPSLWLRVLCASRWFRCDGCRTRMQAALLTGRRHLVGDRTMRVTLLSDRQTVEEVEMVHAGASWRCDHRRRHFCLGKHFPIVSTSGARRSGSSFPHIETCNRRTACTHFLRPGADTSRHHGTRKRPTTQAPARQQAKNGTDMCSK